MERFWGKIALVTGGSSGIGLATDKRLEREGATVIVTGRNRVTLEKAVGEIGGNAHYIQSDSASIKDIELLFDRIIEDFGMIDILFINAGIGRFGTIEAVSEALYDEIFSANTRGAFFTLKNAIPCLNTGASVVVTAIAATSPSWRKAGTSVYTASKVALLAFVEAAAVELAPRGIRVNAICPGPVLTSIYEHAGLPKEKTEERLARIAMESPMKRIGDAEEIAGVVAFLASSDASYMTGRQIQIDGGLR